MNDNTHESTSALMDGEISLDELEALDAHIIDDEMQQKWNRYHLIRDCLQGNLPESVSLDLHEKIHTEINSEPAILAPKRNKTIPYLKPVAGFAIAASVTAAVLLGVQNFQSSLEPGTGLNTIARQELNTVAPPAQFVSFDDAKPQVNGKISEQAEDRMNRYIMNYNEIRANGGVRGMPPYVRMIGYEAE